MNKKILEVKNLHKSFGDKSIHKDVNFSLYKGESLGLLGGSGTGKSVLLRSLIGLESIDSGKILYNSTELQNLTEDQWLEVRPKLSYSFQSGALFDSESVFENLAFPLYEHTKMSISEIENAVEEMLEKVDLKESQKLMPSDLSGGMQKRVGMARSLMLNPDIILYDEPTAGLDPDNTTNVISVMKKFKEEGQSSIFVTHDIQSALEFCDRIMILIDKKIYFNDTPQAFLESEDIKVKKFLQNMGARK